MHKTATRLALIAGLVGLTVGFGTQLGFGMATAQAQTAQPGSARWDYYCFEAADTATITRGARTAGAQGWEMVATNTVFSAEGRSTPTWCFKRPAGPPSSPSPAAK